MRRDAAFVDSTDSPPSLPQFASNFTETKMSLCKSTNLDLKLIKLVKENPVLYDPNEQRYMDFNSREVVWQKIGDEMKRPASECKARWVNIRDINRRILRKRMLNPGKMSKLYKYYNQLSFMKPFYRDVLIQNNFEPEEESNNVKGECDDEDAGETELVPYSDEESDDEKPILTVAKNPKSNSKRRKKIVNPEMFDNSGTSNSNIDTTIPQTDLDPTDKVDSFLLSIGATLKTFSPYYLNLAKSKIFAVVQEYELKQIVSKHGQGGSGADDVEIE